MKRIGAVAVALTAFAAAGASAQSGAMTVVTEPDMQTCVVSGTAAGGAGGSGSFTRVAPALRASGENVVAFASTSSADGGVVRKLTVERQPDGTTIVRDGDGNVIKPTESTNGVYELRSKDGTLTVAGGAGGSMIARVRTAEGAPAVAAMRAADEATATGTSKESPKYHVKRPNTVKAVEGEYAVAEMAMTTAHAQLLAADGVALAKPVHCKVVLKGSDSGN